jgi:flavin-dependent dehydrogenase
MGLETQICVLGGGPAGSVIARRLSQLGYGTVLIERDPRGRRQRVESFPPSITSILDSLMLSDALAAATIQREKRALVQWESDAIRERSFEPASLLVDRVCFDRRLRAAAASAGAVVLAPAHASAPHRSPLGGWVIPVTSEHGRTHITSKFFIDARGRRGGQSLRYGPRTAALSANWHVPGLPYRETRIEAGVNAWFWGCPLTQSLYAATIFVDAHRIAGSGDDERRDLYRCLVSKSELLGGLLSGQITTSISVCDATSRVATDLIGRDFIRVGEAAFSIDPLSSQGVQRAVLSAIQGAAAVHTIQTKGDSNAAIAFYCEHQRRAAKQANLNAIRLHRMRAGDHQPLSIAEATQPKPDLPGTLPLFVRLSDAVEIVDVPVLFGSIISRAAALHHPKLKQPIAYLGEIALAPLIPEVVAGLTTTELLSSWSNRMRPETANHILSWMHALGIVETSSGCSSASLSRSAL